MSAQDAGNPPISEEFFIKVNDVLESVNRIERRLDSHHAEMVILHAFARYSAHHYRITTQGDSQEQREAFTNYMTDVVRGVLANHILDLAGPLAETGSAAEPAAE